MNEEDALHELERRDRESHRRFRQMLLDEGHADVLEEYDARMRDVATGVDGARRTWDALTPPQRRVLAMMLEHKCLVRRPGSATLYDAHEPYLAKACGLRTVRNLIARDLLACAGGALDPEARLELNHELGKFVLDRGRDGGPFAAKPGLPRPGGPS
jgi:hypothetical protein